MLLSRSSEYAVQALLHIASVSEDRLASAREIADRQGLAYPFLGKILQTLVKSGLLESQKGPGGGFALARSADEVTLIEIVHAIDGSNFLEGCILGLPTCGGNHPCPLHDQWADVKQRLEDLFAHQTLSELLDRVKNRN